MPVVKRIVGVELCSCLELFIETWIELPVVTIALYLLQLSNVDIYGREERESPFGVHDNREVMIREHLAAVLELCHLGPEVRCQFWKVKLVFSTEEEWVVALSRTVMCSCKLTYC